MALTEQTILKSVEVLPEQSAVNVMWENQILRDGEVISAAPHRKAYGQEQKDEFLTEVEGASAYVTILGW